MFINPVLLPQLTNRESWTLTVALFDDDTGDPIALTDTNGNPVVSFQFEVRQSGPRSGYGSGGWGGYGPYAGYGSYYDCGPILSASLGKGITLIDTGVFQVYFSETSMKSLWSGTWDVGCTVASNDGVDVRQIFLAKLPILGGRVTN